MPQSQGPELDVAFGQAALVRFPGAGHYKIGDAMIKSGLLIPGGFQSVDMNTVVLIVPAGTSPTDAVVRLTAEIEKLAKSGEIRV
ncbi:MAG TPA: hypothetical protein VLG36_05050 [Candidatus Chromulinivoraceae bacterium]|nr:hypothetical protein [Candidatus Chromulinivoraceae bacterium]